MLKDEELTPRLQSVVMAVRELERALSELGSTAGLRVYVPKGTHFEIKDDLIQCYIKVGRDYNPEDRFSMGGADFYPLTALRGKS